MTKSMTRPVRKLQIIMLALTFATAAYAQTEAQKAFSTLKTLPGTWEGSGMEGADSNAPVRVDFKITGDGSAIMSEIQGHADMISMFHMDGDRLLLTHYCSVGNQPRMQASASPDGKTLTFKFVDAAIAIFNQRFGAGTGPRFAADASQAQQFRRRDAGLRARGERRRRLSARRHADGAQRRRPRPRRPPDACPRRPHARVDATPGPRARRGHRGVAAVLVTPRRRRGAARALRRPRALPSSTPR